MSTLARDLESAAVVGVELNEGSLTFALADGRRLSAPLGWYPRLAHATAEERQRWRIVGRGEGVHWPLLDEDIRAAGLLAGRASTESQTSLARWLEGRAARS